MTYENNGHLSFAVKRLLKPTLVPKQFHTNSHRVREIHLESWGAIGSQRKLKGFFGGHREIMEGAIRI